MYVGIVQKLEKRKQIDTRTLCYSHTNLWGHLYVV